MSGAFWGLLGVIVAVIIYWLQKIRRYPSKLSFTIPYFSPVLNRVPMHFSDLSLKYHDLSIKKDLFYVDFLVFNTRKSDVGLPNTDSSLSVCLPQKTKWVDIQVKNESEGIGSTVNIDQENPSEAILSFHMMRENESIRLEGLIEAHSLDFLGIDEPFLSFRHRIHDLDKLNYIPYISDAACRKSKKTLRRYLVFLILLVGFILALFLVPQNSRILYKNNDTEEKVRVSVNPMNEIVISPYDKVSKGEVITLEEFNEKFTPILQYQTSGSFYYNIAISIFSLLIYCFLVYNVSIDIYRHWIISKITKK